MTLAILYGAAVSCQRQASAQREFTLSEVEWGAKSGRKKDSSRLHSNNNAGVTEILNQVQDEVWGRG